MINKLKIFIFAFCVIIIITCYAGCNRTCTKYFIDFDERKLLFTKEIENVKNLLEKKYYKVFFEKGVIIYVHHFVNGMPTFWSWLEYDKQGELSVYHQFKSKSSLNLTYEKQIRYQTIDKLPALKKHIKYNPDGVIIYEAFYNNKEQKTKTIEYKLDEQNKTYEKVITYNYTQTKPLKQEYYRDEKLFKLIKYNYNGMLNLSKEEYENSKLKKKTIYFQDKKYNSIDRILVYDNESRIIVESLFYVDGIQKIRKMLDYKSSTQVVEYYDRKGEMTRRRQEEFVPIED